ncbi:class I SAM-dependent methyltransferase [Paenibacillus tarimensis]|uniref:class I SAM-dependent methyltransferase n=1 Tax=Paenibacillus tarimensis TaxID=416012 RepID=UPI001F3DC793|nr:methyltransferase domain-containing protein [Paenibacillus tarimensis]MCF2945173.1 class I SAM-dependent methyltransferase [Paenibacillus tarimensis]
MEFRWPCERVVLNCLTCKAGVDFSHSSGTCTGCGQHYRVLDGAPVMLEESGHRAEQPILSEAESQRQAVREMFTTINHSLEEQGVSRFSTFINFGYEPLEEEESSADRHQGVNESSVRMLQEVVKGFELDGRDILEVGCGRGGNVNYICRSSKPNLAVGLDLTEANISFCQNNNRYEQLYFCVGDAEQLPFERESFDVILNVESSHLYPDVYAFYREVYRVLKPGGAFLYADALDVPVFKACMEQLEGMGFEVVLKRDITENVLRSCKTSLKNRYAALSRGFQEEEDKIMNWLAAPGTAKYQDMFTGKRTFHIVQLVKRGNSV